MINLRITEQQFDELYPNLQGLYEHLDQPIPHGTPASVVERRYFSSKLWRLNNLYTVIGKDGKPVIFRMNYAQHRVYAASRQHPRIIILKSRQQGISTMWLVSFFDDATWCPHLTLGLMAQGTDEASTLLDRVKFLWERLNPDIKAFLGVRLTKDNTKEVAFSNNSTIFIRVSFRSATLQRLHISEFGKIANSNPQRAKETKTGTLQALAVGNTGVIESTAEGNNEFRTMWNASILAHESGQMTAKDFYPIFLSWVDDPDCTQPVKQSEDGEATRYFEDLELKLDRPLTPEQRNFWITQRRELGGDLYQEYPATPEEAFLASRDGTYYSRLFNESCVRRGHVKADLYDPNLSTDIYFDLGVDDYAVEGYVQWYRGEYRIVREYWNNGYGIEHYIDEAIASGIEIRDVVLPHDAKQRTMASSAPGTKKARSTYDIAREYIKQCKLPWGVRVLPKAPIADGIAAVRRMVPKLWVDPSCTYIIDCIHNYSKEWDDKLQAWKKTPRHDEYSHGADMLRQVAIGVRESAQSNDSRMAIPKQHKPMTGFAI